MSGKSDEAGVDWDFSLRLPGLRRDEAVVRRAGREPKRAEIIAADGSALEATPIGANIAGRSGDNPTGLQRQSTPGWAAIRQPAAVRRPGDRPHQGGRAGGRCGPRCSPG